MKELAIRKSNVIADTGRDSAGLFVVLKETRSGVTHVAGIPLSGDSEDVDGKLYLIAGKRCSFSIGELVAVTQKGNPCI